MPSYYHFVVGHYIPSENLSTVSWWSFQSPQSIQEWLRPASRWREPGWWWSRCPACICFPSRHRNIRRRRQGRQMLRWRPWCTPLKCTRKCLQHQIHHTSHHKHHLLCQLCQKRKVCLQVPKFHILKLPTQESKRMNILIFTASIQPRKTLNHKWNLQILKSWLQTGNIL